MPEKIFVIEDRDLIPLPVLEWPKIIFHHIISYRYLVQDPTTTPQAIWVPDRRANYWDPPRAQACLLAVAMDAQQI